MTDMGQGRFHVLTVKGYRHFIFEPMLGLGQERDTMPSIAHDTRVYPDEQWTIEERQRFWSSYLDARTGTYEFRCRRYDAVIDRLLDMGMRQADTVLDIGAGRMEFARRLRERGLTGLYIPVDGSIDGCDLNTWTPPDYVDWAVAIETIEHVYFPARLVAQMKVAARFGIAVTTPNPDAVDVLALDPTHVCPVYRTDLAQWGMEYVAEPMFTKDEDTLVGWYDRKNSARSR